MKRISFLLVIAVLFYACKKIPTRSFIYLELSSVDGDTTLMNIKSDLDYNQNHTFKFIYDSDYELDTVYIRLTKDFKGRISGVDEERIDNVPAKGSMKGEFVYTLKPSEQCKKSGTGGLAINYFIKLVFINKVGTHIEKKVQFRVN